METDRICLSCDSLSGKARINPGCTIYSGIYWDIEHVYPTSIQAWLVLVLKRHAEALHDLTSEEWIERELLITQACKILHDTIAGCHKEYVVTFCEKEGFEHLHTHIVPVFKDMPEEFKGTNIFSALNIEKSLSEKEIIGTCERLKVFFNPPIVT